jgi:predicted ATPase with chaperone activity
LEDLVGVLSAEPPVRTAKPLFRTNEADAFWGESISNVRTPKRTNLTARAYHRVHKLSRTITDLADEKVITQVHLAEKLQYRPKLDLS